MSQTDTALAHLEGLFLEVRRAVMRAGAGSGVEVKFNAKGDRVRSFDTAAHEAACAYLGDRFPWPVEVLSEEDAPRRVGAGEPEFTVILDPVDGSDNFARGIAPSAVAVALTPAGEPIAVDTVQFALVGDLLTGEVWRARRGQGASSNGRALRTTAVTLLEEAMLSCEMNHFAVGEKLTCVLSRARGVRAFGCATWALVKVAGGALDAHLDLRGRLTPENFLAPSLILAEAGGVVTDGEGKALPPVRGLTERFSVVAAATPDLHAALMRQLNESPPHEE